MLQRYHGATCMNFSRRSRVILLNWLLFSHLHQLRVRRARNSIALKSQYGVLVWRLTLVIVAGYILFSSRAEKVALPLSFEETRMASCLSWWKFAAKRFCLRCFSLNDPSEKILILNGKDESSARAYLNHCCQSRA